MRRSAVIFCLMFAVLTASARNKNVDSLLSILKESKCVEGERIGITGVRSYKYKAAQQLWEISTSEELKKLCSHKNNVIRCYAFLGLIVSKNDRKLAEQIADKHFKDKKIITTWNGCIQMKFTVSDYMEMKLRDFYSTDGYIYKRLK